MCHLEQHPGTGEDAPCQEDHDKEPDQTIKLVRTTYRIFELYGSSCDSDDFGDVLYEHCIGPTLNPDQREAFARAIFAIDGEQTDPMKVKAVVDANVETKIMIK